MKLIERYLTLFDKDKKEEYVDDVWEIIENSYRSIGGCNSSKEELMMDGVFWKLVRKGGRPGDGKGGKIVAAVIYKTQLGRKAFLAGSDGTTEGKQALYSIISEDAEQKERNAGVEVSGAPEHLYKKYGHVPIPNEVAEEILNKIGKKVTALNPDGYHYTRKIGNQEHEKIMMGTLKMK